MGIAHRIIAVTAATAALTLTATGLAVAEEDSEKPSSPLVQYIESWPPAPEGCAEAWDPLEDAIEDSVPESLEAEFDAFDDWCEGDAD